MIQNPTHYFSCDCFWIHGLGELSTLLAVYLKKQSGSVDADESDRIQQNSALDGCQFTEVMIMESSNSIRFNREFHWDALRRSA
jgi:hypothetical protein